MINYIWLYLGRRIEFDYEKFGHSPSCLGSNTNIFNGKEAVVQGYGRAEDGINFFISVELKEK